MATVSVVRRFHSERDELERDDGVVRLLDDVFAVAIVW